MQHNIIDRLFEFKQISSKTSLLQKWILSESLQPIMELLKYKENYLILLESFGYDALAKNIPINHTKLQGDDSVSIAQGLNCPEFWYKYNKNTNYFNDIKTLENLFLKNTSLSLYDICMPNICKIYGEKINNDLIIPPVFYRFGIQLDFLINNVFLKNNVNTMVEIGGGFGGMGYLVKKNRPHIKYIQVDIPTSIIIQAYLLNKLGYKIVLYNEINLDTLNNFIKTEDFDFLFLLPEHFQLLENNSIDVIINADSLVEMNQETIEYYVENISRITNYFYTVNREYLNYKYLESMLDKYMKTNHSLIKSEYQIGFETQFFFSIGLHIKYKLLLYSTK
jgi:hypothetical protein